MEGEITRPVDQVGFDDGGSVEGVVPVLICAFPFTDIGFRGPTVHGLVV
jgi:hypothetical protein